MRKIILVNYIMCNFSLINLQINQIMKKILRLATGLMLCLLPLFSSAQTYSSWGKAVKETNHMYDTITGYRDSLQFSFPNTPSTAWGNPRLIVYYEGYFGWDNLDVYDENLNNAGSAGNNQNNCGPEDSTIITLSAANINLWNTNNSIVFTFMNNVNPNCSINRVRARLVYNYCLSGVPAQIATVSISNSFICSADGPSALTGVPAGGVFSGTGVTGASFNPTSLSAGNYVISYTATDSQTCTSTGTINVQVRPKPIVNNNNTVYACQNSTVSLHAANGNNFVWFSNAALTNVLDTAKIFTTPTLTQTTTYWVAATDENFNFKIDTVKNSNYAIVDQNNLAGDDRGGMAITKNYVYLNGDNNAVRYDLNLTPSSGISLPIRDGMFSDLRDGHIWTLWNTTANEDPQSSPNTYYADALRGLDSNLNFTNEFITLSQTIELGNNNMQNGIFSGTGVLGLYSGNTQHWYVVDLDNGNVSDLGFLNDGEFYGSENWSDWGIIESTCTGTYSVIYRDYNDDDIHRRELPNGAVTSIGTFPGGISDMASLTYNPWNSRWYFHYEGGSSTFGGSSETLGYADASDATSNCGGSGLGCPAAVVVHVPTKVTLSVSSSTVCLNDGAISLNGGAPVGGTYSGIGVGTNTTGTVFYPALSGNGTYTITYTQTDVASGCTASSSTPITVNACTGIEELALANNVTVFPNPNNGNFNISFNDNMSSLFIEITDVQGRIVFSSSETNINAGTVKQINLSSVEAGLYFVKLKTANEQRVQRVSVIH